MRTKIHNPKPRHASPAGFTLIELLVVIAIIGILAGVAGPGLVNAQRAAQASAAMQKARQIAIGLRGYALDNGGAYPSGENMFGESINSANAAFRDLADYIEDESVYAVNGSNWGAKADNRIDGPGEYVQAGENHFAYISGLDTLSRSTWPLIVDGTDGSGTYSTDRTQRGGVWSGKRGVMVSCDGSGSVMKLSRSNGGEKRFLPRGGEPRENALETSYMGDRVELLDPEG
ncbi:MAG: prepilin-type N-terminal cleavage/methylation domain-containing protein [Verrucomicrobiales bacterium]|jgi:prepilin-type N-terminal cleavage/methylation domain-containing protein